METSFTVTVDLDLKCSVCNADLEYGLKFSKDNAELILDVDPCPCQAVEEVAE